MDPAEVEKAQRALRGFLLGDDRRFRNFRGVMQHIPSSPRCKLCTVPFEGPGGAVLRHVGFGRFAGNPAICDACIKPLQKVGVFGVEIPVSLLFADIRGSTTIGERMSPTDFRAFLDRFYRITSGVILDGNGLLDKFVGDEAIGLFFAGVSGPDHSAAAIAAGRRLLDEVGQPNATPSGPIPVGAAVHTGEAYVGSSGAEGIVNDFTALGDVVNTTARLASAAAAGELLVSVDAAAAGGFDAGELERRVIDVRGRVEPIEVLSIRAGAPTTVATPT
jgi:adenylate cyclase